MPSDIETFRQKGGHPLDVFQRFHLSENRLLEREIEILFPPKKRRVGPSKGDERFSRGKENRHREKLIDCLFLEYVLAKTDLEVLETAGLHHEFDHRPILDGVDGPPIEGKRIIHDEFFEAERFGFRFVDARGDELKIHVSKFA